jgi:hypothetical protein
MNVETIEGPGVQELRRGAPSLRQLAHPFPVRPAALAASRERESPVPLDLGSEGLQCVDVGRAA